MNSSKMIHITRDFNRRKKRNLGSSTIVSRDRISVVPSLCARWYAHEFIKFFNMNVAAFPLQCLQSWRNHKKIMGKAWFISCFSRGRGDLGGWISYPSHPVMENRRSRVVTACSLMIILLFKSFTASLIFTDLRFVYINYLLCLRWTGFLRICIAFARCIHRRFRIWFSRMWTWRGQKGWKRIILHWVQVLVGKWNRKSLKNKIKS